jgi:uncharacterized membrane protein HdeD (DUF308 family)
LTDVVERQLRRIGLTVSKPVLAIICIVFGIIVIVVPQFLAIVVGVFLIIQGVLVLTDYMEMQRQQKPQP